MDIVRLKENIAKVKANIERARQKSGQEVKLVCVTKEVDTETIRQLLKLGQRDIGENKFQVARAKVEQLKKEKWGEINWHFVGRLQTNKAKYIVENFSLIHSLSTLHLAQALEQAAQNIGKIQEVLIQLNVSGEAVKQGVAAAEAEQFLEQLKQFSHIKVAGLMTMAPFVDNPEKVRAVFKRVKEIFDNLKNRAGTDFKWLSMGMSNDYQVAVEEGANMVRIGTVLFE